MLKQLYADYIKKVTKFEEIEKEYKEVKKELDALEISLHDEMALQETTVFGGAQGNPIVEATSTYKLSLSGTGNCKNTDYAIEWLTKADKQDIIDKHIRIDVNDNEMIASIKEHIEKVLADKEKDGVFCTVTDNSIVKTTQVKALYLQSLDPESGLPIVNEEKSGLYNQPSIKIKR